MKPLEEVFFRACVNEQKRKLCLSERELSIRTIGNIFERLGFSYKQLLNSEPYYDTDGILHREITKEIRKFTLIEV